MKGITFIGMAGAGKSAVGKITAKHLGWRFVDLDKLILETQGMSHHDYMQKHGEEALKQLEENLTMDLNLQHMVFSPPGSVIYSDSSMQKVKDESAIIYLRATPQTIEKRLGDRLYKNGVVGLKEKGLAKLMAERAVFYEKYADYTFDTGDQSVEEMSKKVIDGLLSPGVNIHISKNK